MSRARWIATVVGVVTAAAAGALAVQEARRRSGQTKTSPIDTATRAQAWTAEHTAPADG